MSTGWRARWRRLGRTFPGGQGESFLAASKSNSADRAFIKTLKRPRDRRARRRFRREVTSYETLTAIQDSLPRLREHNAEDWEDLETPLYMVLEYIDGVTLKEYIDHNGAQDLSVAVSIFDPLADVLEVYHREGIVHRDIKPSNVLLRGSNPAAPVLVDFGLSFNHAGSDTDLTKIGEEVGNRFLRLPEHATGGRSHLADITQCAGIVFYAMTARESRVLLDEAGRMPHQRTEIVDLLRAATESERHLIDLQDFFDRAFATNAARRFQAVEQMKETLRAVVNQTLSTEATAYETLVAQVDAITSQARAVEATERVRRISDALTRASAAVKSFASGRGLQLTQSGHRVVGNIDEPYGQTKPSLRDGTVPSNEPVPFRQYTIRIVGGDLLLVVDDETQWRGSELNAEFHEAVVKSAIEQYLSTRENPTSKR